MRRWTLWRGGIALAGVLALLLLLRGPALLGATWRNAGMLVLRDGLIAEADVTPGTYPVYKVLGENPVMPRAIQSLRRAVALDEDDFSAQWALGRAALAAGDAEAAASALEPLMGKVGRNPLLYQDVLIALSYGGRPGQVIALYESAPLLQRTQAISDAVALAYLDLGTGRQEDAGTGGQEGVGQWLERAHAVRPGDLYVNYRLWQQAQEAGDAEAAAVYSETLNYFPLEAIHPADERLLGYAADAVPGLLEEGLWDRDKVLNVASFLVWQHDGAVGVERLLEWLIERYPAEPDWPFYLAELYYRRGNLEQAEVAYRQVLAAGPAYAQAYWQLGMVAEAQSQISNLRSQAQLAEAAGWYEQYWTMVPQDLLGLKRLAEVCTALEEAGVEDTTCREAAEQAVGGLGEGETAGALWAAWLEQVAAAEPEHLVVQELDNGWTFLGYDGDEERLIRGEPTALLLYWVGPVSASAGSERNGWYQAGERWVQVLQEVQNLVPNGGFELGVEAGSPTGFPWDIYHADPETRRLVTDVRTGQRTAVALLSNTEVYSATSFASLYVPVNPDGLYLQAGWMKSVGGNGYLGRGWAGDLAAGVRPYNYVVTSVKEGDWRHYAGLTRPLDGANRCQIWLINWKAVGQVYFDNVVFVEIGLPQK